MIHTLNSTLQIHSKKSQFSPTKPPNSQSKQMSTLRLSPAAISGINLPKSPISSSLLRRRSPLKISPPCRRRLARGSSAAATMLASPATSYASALAQLSKSNNTLEATMSELDNLKTIFSDSSIQSFFINPTISDDTKLDVIKEIAASAELQTHTLNFLNILVDMKRVDLFDEIVEEFENSYNEITGTTVAVVSSVVKIESQQLSLIAKTVQRLTGARNVRIKSVIDDELVAGFTIRYGNTGSKLIDLSVKKQLDEIAEKIDLSSLVIG